MLPPAEQPLIDVVSLHLRIDLIHYSPGLQ